MEARETMSSAQTHRDAESLLAHGDFLRALVARLVSDDSTADDIVQATWLSALKHPPRTGGSARAWLYRVAQNHVRQLRRGEGRRRAREQEPRPSLQVPSPADIVERESARRAVVDAVVELGEPYRSTILLRFYEDLPPRKVAKVLGVPVETVRTRTRRGLEQLRQRLDGEYGNDRESWSRAVMPLLLLRPAAPAVLPVSALVVAATVACCLFFAWRLAGPDRPTPATESAVPTVVTSPLPTAPDLRNLEGLGRARRARPRRRPPRCR